jgi:hypothetical protein
MMQNFKTQQIEKGQLILKRLASPRKGWEQAFKEMAERGDRIEDHF